MNSSSAFQTPLNKVLSFQTPATAQHQPPVGSPTSAAFNSPIGPSSITGSLTSPFGVDLSSPRGGGISSNFNQPGQSPLASQPFQTTTPPNPFSLQAASFGQTIFPELVASPSAQTPFHFPSIAGSLLQSGFARSASILLECSMTFYAQGLQQNADGDYQLYKTQPKDIGIIPTPSAMALFGQCCLYQGEYRRATQYLKTALSELQKLKRSVPYSTNPQVQQMTILNSPEREWTLSLVEAFLAVHDDAQAQKLLENMYLASVSNPNAPGLPVKYMLTLARFYSAPPSPTSPAIQQNYLVQNKKAAIAIHTRLLQMQPLAIESALELIKLQVDPRPIVAASLATHYPSRSTELSQQCIFLYLFLTSQWNVANGQFQEALSTAHGGLNFLNTIVPRSTYLHEVKAQVQLMYADAELALRTLERMHTIDPYALGSMDLLALLYARRGALGGGNQGGTKELATLMAHTLRIDECRHEAWCVAACSSALIGHKDKAIKYMDKAIMLVNHAANKTATESLSKFASSVPYMIKGLHLLEWERQSFAEKKAAASTHISPSPYLDQSISAFRKALLAWPQNHLANYGLACCHVLQGQMATHATQPNQLVVHPSYKTAIQLVESAALHPLHSTNPRVLCNYGLIFAQTSEHRQKAAKIFHKALQVDAEYGEAVLALADMYLASQQYTDALTMLLGYTAKVATELASGRGPMSLIQMMLGSRDYFLVKIAFFYALSGEVAEAMSYYKQALAINPNCKQAMEGMAKLEQDSKAALEEEMEAEAAGDMDMME